MAFQITTALGTAIDLLDGGDTEHEAAKDELTLVARNRYLLNEYPPRHP